MHPLIWPDCRNVRDLAGLPTTTGELQPDRLIRSDNLDQLTPTGRAAVEALDISRFVDLRSAWECETWPSPYADDARWRNVPLWDPGDRDVSDLDLFEMYRILIDDYNARVASAVTAIADAPPGAVVVNCHAGKDRTGIVIALTLDLSGVPEDLIATDYATSEASASTILRLLGHVRQRYGGTRQYLLGSGASRAKLDVLIARLTT
ncbi:tyrosine-protein phosphatase [Kribbella speibonae]|uniref:tyrosine-protein phosphatase n=1 Tax=Kribbella speibonae TaxID=1572660 RepID=UPI0013F3E408|nr:tyrosine-protein phosphatase [Kribbella speibonae]